jgi:hypothetical protein
MYTVMEKKYCTVTGAIKFMEIFTKNSAKCTIFQSTYCNNFFSLMYLVMVYLVALLTCVLPTTVDFSASKPKPCFVHKEHLK